MYVSSYSSGNTPKRCSKFSQTSLRAWSVVQKNVDSIGVLNTLHLFILDMEDVEIRFVCLVPGVWPNHCL